MTVKQLLSVIIVALFLVPLSLQAETVRELLTGKYDVPAYTGVHKYYRGRAVGHKIDEDRECGTVKCVEGSGFCFELVFTPEIGWYVDIYYKTNSIIPPIDPNEIHYRFRVPQKEGEEVQVEVIFDGNNPMR